MTSALTPRHVDIVRLLAEGLTKQQIGNELHLSVDTVKTHLKTIYGRLGARNAPHAVLLAQRAGYLEPAEIDSELAVA